MAFLCEAAQNAINQYEISSQDYKNCHLKVEKLFEDWAKECHKMDHFLKQEWEKVHSIGNKKLILPEEIVNVCIQTTFLPCDSSQDNKLNESSFMLKKMKSFPNIVGEQRKTNSTLCSHTLDFFDSKDLIECYDTSVQTSFQVLNPNDDIYVSSPDIAAVPVIMPVFDNLADGVENQTMLKTLSCSNQDLLSKTYSIGDQVPVLFNTTNVVYSESPLSICSGNAKTPSDNLGSPSSKSFYKSSPTDNLETPTNKTYSIRQKKRSPLMNCATLSSTCNENVENWIKKKEHPEQEHLESVGLMFVSEANDTKSNDNDAHSFVKRLKEKEQHEPVHFESAVFTPGSEASDSNFINPNDTDVRMSLVKKARLAYLEEADELYDNPNDTKKNYSFYPKKHPVPLQITKEPRNERLSVFMIDKMDKMPCIDIKVLSPELLPEDVDTPDCRLDSIDFKIHPKSTESFQHITVDQSTQCLHLYNENLINHATNKNKIIEDEVCTQQHKVDLTNPVENACSKETMFEEKNQHSFQIRPEIFAEALPYSRTDNFKNLVHNLTTSNPENLTFETENKKTAFKQSKNVNKKKNFRKKHRKICMPKTSKKCAYVDSKYTFISYSNYREKAIDSNHSMCLRKVSKSSVSEVEQSIQKQSLNHIDKKARLENILEVEDFLCNSGQHINNIIEIKDPSFIHGKISNTDPWSDPGKIKILVNSSCNTEQASHRNNLLNEALKENMLLDKKTVLLNGLSEITVHDSSKFNDCTVCSIKSDHSNSANESPISNVLCGKCICALKGMVKSNVRASKRIAEKGLLIQTLLGNSCKKSKKDLAAMGINLNLDKRENKPIYNDLGLNSECVERSKNVLQPVTRSGRYCRPLETVSISNKKTKHQNSPQFKPELTQKTVTSPGSTSHCYNLRTSKKSFKSSNLSSRKSNSNKSILKKSHTNLTKNYCEQSEFYKLSEKALSRTKTIICHPSPKKDFLRTSIKKKSKSHKPSHVSFIYENHLMVCSEGNLKSSGKRRFDSKKPVAVDSIQVADKAMIRTMDTNMVAFQESCNLQKGNLGYVQDSIDAKQSPLQVLQSSKEKRPEMRIHVSFIDKELVAVNQKKTLRMVKKKPLNKTSKKKVTSTTDFIGGYSNDGLVSEYVEAVSLKTDNDRTEIGKKKRLSISAERRVSNSLLKKRGRRTSLFYVGKRKKTTARASTKANKVKEFCLNVKSPKKKTHTRNHTQSLNAQKSTSKKFNKKDANLQNSTRLVKIQRTLPNEGSSKMKNGVKRNAQRNNRKDLENPLVTPALDNSFPKTSVNDSQEFQTKNLKKCKIDIPYKKTRKNKLAKYYSDNQNALKFEILSDKIEDVSLRKKAKYEDKQSEERLGNYEKKDERAGSRLYGEKTEIEFNSSNDNTNSSTLLNATVIKKSVVENVRTPIRCFPEGPANVKFSIDSNVSIDSNIMAIPRPFFTKLPAKDVLMKPPVAPKNHNAIMNVSALSCTTNISRISGETTASFIGRKKKTLLNKQGNKFITPDRRRSPLNSTVAQHHANLGKSHTELYRSFIETNGSNISAISRLGGNTAAGNATLGIPETLAQYLEKFNPPPLTFVTQQ